MTGESAPPAVNLDETTPNITTTVQGFTNPFAYCFANCLEICWIETWLLTFGHMADDFSKHVL